MKAYLAQRIAHPFGPLFSAKSEVLILGSFPSVKSREQHFFYGHPQNRFWKVIAALYHAEMPVTIPEKKELILRSGLALWDTIASCTVWVLPVCQLRITARSGKSAATEKLPGSCMRSGSARRQAGKRCACPPRVRRMRSGRWKG